MIKKLLAVALSLVLMAPLGASYADRDPAGEKGGSPKDGGGGDKSSGDKGSGDKGSGDKGGGDKSK